MTGTDIASDRHALVQARVLRMRTETSPHVSMSYFAPQHDFNSSVLAKRRAPWEGTVAAFQEFPGPEFRGLEPRLDVDSDASWS